MKKLVSIVTVILMVLGLMIPAFAGAEQVITTTSILEDGTKLIRIEHLLPLGDRKIGRLSVRNENGAKYVEEYKLIPCEEWEDEDGYIYHRDNINRTVMVYMCNGLLVAEYSF